MRGYLTFLNTFDHIEVNSWADSPECFLFLHVRNATPAPGWFQPQEKCLNRQQLAGFPLFSQKYQNNSEKKINMKLPTGFVWFITSFEGGIDLTESKTQRSSMSFQIYLGQIWTPELIRLQGHAALFTQAISCKSPPSNIFPPPLASDISWIHSYIMNFHFTKPFLISQSKYFFQVCPLPLPFRIYTGHNPHATKADSSPSLLLATTIPASSSWFLSTTWFFQNTTTSRTSLKNTGAGSVWFSNVNKTKEASLNKRLLLAWQKQWSQFFHD